MQMPENWISFMGKKGIKKLEVIASKVRSVDTLPSENLWFESFRSISPENVRVVILGQDPYPQRGAANGYAFAYDGEVENYPYSLYVIRKRLTQNKRQKVDLKKWSKEGVLLLNTALTVKHNSPGSHIDHWHEFTECILSLLAKRKTHKPPVFVLWGRKAQKTARTAKVPPDLCIFAPHPCRWQSADNPLQKINETLHADPVNWSVALL